MAHATSRGESDLLVLFWIFDTHRLPPSVFGAPPFPAALRTVVTPAPTALAICRQLSPAARSSRTVSRRNTFRGRPIGLPDLVPFRNEPVTASVPGEGALIRLLYTIRSESQLPSFEFRIGEVSSQC